jgi:hypothetical protein
MPQKTSSEENKRNTLDISEKRKFFDNYYERESVPLLSSLKLSAYNDWHLSDNGSIINY